MQRQVFFSITHQRRSSSAKIMNSDELKRIILKKQKKINQLESILIAHKLYDAIEELQ